MTRACGIVTLCLNIAITTVFCRLFAREATYRRIYMGCCTINYLANNLKSVEAESQTQG